METAPCSPASAPCGGCHFGAQALLLLAQLRGEVLAEILGLEHLPDLDLLPVREGGALEPRDRLVERLDLPQPEAGDQFLGMREGPSGDCAILSGETHAHAFRARLKALPCQ